MDIKESFVNDAKARGLSPEQIEQEWTEFCEDYAAWLQLTDPV